MSQASQIIEKFGSVPALSRALAAAGVGRDLTTIYKWTYPKDKGGTGGYIPTSAHADIKKAARREGILLTAQDWYGE